MNKTKQLVNLDNYVIIIPQNCTEAIKNASVQLLYYILKTTGIELKAVNDTSNHDFKKFISLGDTNVVDFNKNELKKDGFIFDVKDENVRIVSLNDSGVLYGTYHFIEKILGVKFFAKDSTYIPSHKKIYLIDTHMICNPTFEMRSFFTSDVIKNLEFSSHLRLNNEWMKQLDEFGEPFELANTKCHNIFDFIDKNKYYETHPEWFFVYDGKIKDICYSHVGLNADGTINNSLEESPVKIIANNFLNMLLDEKNKKYKYFMLGQQDTFDIYVYCKCDDCSTQTEYYGRSGMLIRFVNAVSDFIKNELNKRNICREFYIITFAYLWSELPPYDYVNNRALDDSVIPRDNVFIRLAPINSRNYYGVFEDGQIDSTKRMFKFWPKITKNLMVWTYNIEFGGFFTYYPTVQHIKKDFALFKKINVKYVMCQSSCEESHIWFDRINSYIFSKLLWDNTLNVKKLRKEFISFYYGVASKFIEKFIQNFDNQYSKFLNKNILACDRPSTRIGCATILSKSKYFSKDFWEEQNSLLVHSKKVINDSHLSSDDKALFLKRIDEVFLTAQYMVLLDYDSYFLNNIDGKKMLFKEFCENCKNLGVRYISEHSTLEDFEKNFII